MKLPHLKIRKSTRSTLSGLAIGAASLYALATAYAEARDNLLRFFISCVLLLVLVMVFALLVVALVNATRYLWRRIVSRELPEEERRKE
jgi:predicted membrane-bound dolichyl-phosphate-mannose-protein mannosyltransferase